MIEPRPYQQNAVDYYFDMPERSRVPIHCAPTGSGKTVIQALIAQEEMNRGRSVSILTPRIEIFEQTEKLLGSLVGWQNVSTLRAGERWNRSNPIHVVSWPTLTARVRKSKVWFPDVDAVLVDEAHLSMAPKIRDALYHFLPRAKIHGFTATPARASGKGLGAFYTEIKHVTSVRQLIKEGYLAPCEYWAGSYADTQGLKVRNGDWEQGKLSERSVELVGDVIDNWLRLASERHTLVFAVDVAHAEALLDRFLQVGISAGVLHSKQDPAKRRMVVEKFRDRTYQVLVNVNIASYGFDCPSIDCVVAARKTRSLVLWLQMIGRGMRPNDGKDFCMILDHGDNTRRLGAAADLFRWRLTAGKSATENWSRKEDSGESEEAQHTTCKNCEHMFSRTRVCPMCGWEKPLAKKDIDTKDADLVRISEERAQPIEEGWPNRETFYRMLLHYGRSKGYKNPSGWAAHKYKKKIGDWPDRNWEFMATVEPSQRVAAWVHKQQQNYARRQAYAKRGKKSGQAAANKAG